MIKEVEIKSLPALAYNDEFVKSEILKQLKAEPGELTGYRTLRYSIDARRSPVQIVQRVQVALDEPLPADELTPLMYKNVGDAQKRVLIVGLGPAGMFAALRLIELGVKPVVLERGYDVRTRRRDLKAVNRDHIVNPDSNYCFGEGGAGTYSDGKLYTRSTKRGDVRRIYDLLVHHGANPFIRVDAHPHIGTNKLPGVVQAIRERILEHGGEIYFGTRVVDFVLQGGRVTGVVTRDGAVIEGDALILATGHSARDIFELLQRKQISLELKPFALGVRVEHPQALIDHIQYHGMERGEHLPAARYKLVHQVAGRGVYSFCMCPGGFIVPAATAQEEIVVNGMSPSKRDSRFANSGIVVEILPDDVAEFKKDGPLAALRFQQMVERRVWEAGGKTQSAPAQRLIDFINGKVSTSLPECSYIPGLTPVNMHEVLPEFVSFRLKEGFKAFGRKMKGYLNEEAQIVATESRTSSPVKIPRNPETLMHPEVGGLFPAGEGGGYAGGIVSAAMDGERVAEKVVEFLQKLP
ncbi:FAD-dependent dehydrogenase [Thermaurantimonas aggregans]|uniref:FAD-dependent dehydrogenase n=1 Tax=Thermaurantimonas aggregans TaxID=2173829 RepID=A0A401XJ58_9FLAO|nr:FAD-dependent oxidoreductase [Thermaurantimonas aggregans]MCX8149669.1 FAD-dependent oxidoreductase [Thermaurantimonas aggregans]GCD77067.1 FAD-dependent dehydrogenase [Thermaurantimonas aggregans]